MFVIQIQCKKCGAIIQTCNLYFKKCPKCGDLIHIDPQMAMLVRGNFKLFKRKIDRCGYERHLLFERYKSLLADIERRPVHVGSGTY